MTSFVTVTNPEDFPGGGDSSGLTDAQLRASPVPVSGAFTIQEPLSVDDNGGSLTVDGSVSVSNFPATQPVSGTVAVSGSVAVTGPLTDAQLRAVAVPVSGTVAVSGSVAVTGPLTDTQLRATPVPVSGTVSTGGLTDTQLRATPVPVSGTVTANAGSGTMAVSLATLPALTTGAAVIGSLAANQSVNNAQWIGSTAPTVGQKTMANSLPVVISSDQSTLPVTMAAASVLFRGRASAFRTPGRAGTTGQNIFSIHNATGSAVKVYITRIAVDVACTVVKAITVLPPIIRVWKITALPSNGTPLAKTKIGGTTTSNASVTVSGDASADGVGSATTLTTVRPAGAILTQEYAGRFITGVGYEPMDRVEFDFDGEIELNALEGIVVFLDYSLATQNPTTDMWIVTAEFYEKT